MTLNSEWTHERGYPVFDIKLQKQALWVAGLLFWLASPGPASATPTTPGPVELNQHFVEAVWEQSGSFTPAEQDQVDASRRSLEEWSAKHRATEPVSVDFEAPQTVLSYVFSQIPSLAIVYPTETYYYWRFSLGDRTVSGNFRLLDAQNQQLHIGYFDVEDGNLLRAQTFTPDDGLQFRNRGDGRFEITYEDRTVVFVLASRALEGPQKLRLMDYEEAVTGVLDESGIAFHLLYNRPLEAFYFVLNEDIPRTEGLAPVTDGSPFLVGERSQFVFFHDRKYDRKLLVGVYADSIRMNDYYDGPFDQVPPRLPIRDRIEAAYPYVKMRGGIDPHGNFLNVQGSRVAVSPYLNYESISELIGILEPRLDRAVLHADLWLLLTYESKRDYHTKLQAFENAAENYAVWQENQKEFADHSTHLSQGWPANHWGETSFSWSPEHETSVSSKWPANHGLASSQNRAATAHPTANP